MRPTRTNYSCLGHHSKRTDCASRSSTQKISSKTSTITSTSPDFRRNLETLLRHGLKQLRTYTDAEREQLETTKQTIERRQRKLLEAHYNDAIPIDILRTEQKRLDTELAATTRSFGNLTEADELIGIALDIAQHAGNTYR